MMKLFAKRAVILTAVAAMALGIFSGCGSTPPTSDAGSVAAGTAAGSTADKPKSDGKLVEISAMIFDRGSCPEGEGSVTENRWTKWINEEMAKKGVKVKFIPVPRSEEATKIPVMMASGTAADIMLLYNASLVQKFFNDGGTHDLAPLLAGAPQLTEYLGEECLSYGKNEAGAQWAIPARRSTTAQSNANIRKDWLDKLGLAIPKTVDELYNAFKAFKEQDPGGVGKDNVVCYTGNGLIQTAFLKNVDDNVKYMTGKGFEAYADEGFIDYLKFRNKMYNEGLMDPEYFTSKNFSQKEKELCVSGYLGYWEYDVNGNVDTMRGGLLQNLKKNIPNAEFVSMVPIANIKDKQVYNWSYPLTGAFVFVPKTAEDPEACMKYLDFLAGEGGFRTFHGVEGEHYTLVDGVPVVKDPDHNAKTKDWTRHDIFLVGNQGYYKTEQDFIAATSKELPGWETYVTDNYANAMAGTRLPNVDYTSATQTEQSANITKVNDDYTTKCTTCKPEEVDTLFAEWKKELEKYSIQTVIEERNAYFSTIYK